MLSSNNLVDAHCMWRKLKRWSYQLIILLYFWPKFLFYVYFLGNRNPSFSFTFWIEKPKVEIQENLLKKSHFQTPFQKEEITHPWCVTKICQTHITHGQILSIQRSKFPIRKTEHCSYTINEFAVHGNFACLIYITLFWVSEVCGQNPMEWPSTMNTILQLCLDKRTDIQLISERISRNHLYLYFL